ncbi:hypothetical protein BDV32DRAFT_149371 [Aspergillus pseudonomiae]|uniref:Uncharacterized protein n=1 Tax=Aspergillus pseudonomiae TaxID=1506151 RepID=A0A5N6I1S2_9EURO|nr:uncharacterized protein BDV37DRAFT_284038 [Aspergillus pseudonomiae]KAB8260665.1 hypothetical protein BDV32DRAFT_149371 [Aspergillus pseudonomiae]KAE8403046.1 hypothetical protein BDV37DRAFT_284038 [Aspergillus pseudonomiae]
MDQIDLSSLEGPPVIHRPHSTNPYSGVPSIQLDYSAFPLEAFDGLPSHPPRPASAEPVPSSRQKSPSIAPGVNWHRRERGNMQHPADLTPGNGIRQGASERRIDCSAARRPISHPGHSSPLGLFNPHPRVERPIRVQSASPSHQLIWLDEQNIWVRAEITISTNFPGQVPTLTHSRSMDTYLTNNGERDADIPSSPPPPYEQHVFDQLIASRRVSRGEPSSRMAAHDSMWTAVAGRRAHRAPFGN